MKERGYSKNDPEWRMIHDELHNEGPMNYKELKKFIELLLGKKR